MTKTTRLGLLAAAGALALASAGSALASFSPKLWAANGTANVTIKVQVGASDDPTAQVVIYAPAGYQLKDPPPAGTKLGAITAQAQAADLGGAILPLTGDLVAADPAQFAGPPNNVCVPGTHAQVWILNLTAAGQTLQVPMYVDPLGGGGFKITTCLPPPDVPTGTPGRATFGAKLLAAEFGSSAVIPSGSGVWHSIWTPYTPGKGTPNAAGSVEAQSKVGGAATLSLTARKGVLTARVSPAAAGARVAFLSGKRSIGSAATNAAGVATKKVKVKKKTGFSATVTTADADLGSAGCAAALSAAPCVDATVKGGKVSSRTVTLKP